MKIDKALAHLAKKIGGNQYSTDYDKECIQTLIEYVQDSREEKMRNQDLYYKLYLYLFNQFVNQYDEVKSQVRLHKILEMPIQFHIDQLTSSMNHRQLYEDLALDTDQEVTHERVEAFFKSRLWSTTEVEENVRQMAQKALETYL
jgi:hypothetical protein